MKVATRRTAERQSRRSPGPARRWCADPALLYDPAYSARLLLDLARAGSQAPGIDPARTDEVARRAFTMAVHVNDRAVALQADALLKELAGRVAP